MIDLLVMLAASGITGILGLIVLLRNPHDIAYKLFSFLTLMGVLWGFANYTTNHISGYQAQLFANKLSLFVGFLLIQAIWLLSLYFPRRTGAHTIQKLVSVLITPALLLLILFTPHVVASVTYDPSKMITDIQTGSLYYLYVAAAAVFFAYLISNFYHAYTAQDVTRLQRQQVLYASSGLLLSFLWAILVAAIIPSVTHNWEISKFGTLGALFTVTFISYSIVRHRLFDIRLVVARSIAYLTSLVVVASFYGFLVFGTADLIFDLHFSLAVQMLISAATAVASLSFASIKSFFDRVTNRLFFRDSYDTQVFFDEFNQTLVATYELDELLKESIKIIGQNIKPTHCQFIISKTANTDGRIMGTANKPALDAEDLKTVREVIHKTRSKLVVADELEAKHEALQKHLRTKDIVLTAALTSSSSGSKTEVGYLLLGPKKSGNLYSSQDIKVLEIVANELVIAVQNALRFEEIESFNITLQAKVDEATKKLRRANEKLRALDETKDDFISMASHQLRTPLTSVKGYISMVLEGDTGKIKPKQKDMLGQAFFSSQRMVYLIADLLNVSRLKTGKFVIDSVPVNLADVVDQELGQLKETAAAHQLKLTYDKPKKFPELMLDETKTRQVIMNFVDNAIYYTPSGGEIKVRLIESPTTIELRVEDNGIGVPASEKPHMFTKFYRAGNARKARPDGTGLGLFMAKKVIVSQGGSLVFESQEGKGSTFGFVFSKAKHAVSAKAPTVKTPPPPPTAAARA